MNPKVSVLIGVKNEEKYLEQCLDSVLNQTYQNFEIILIDDGSTDKTPQIIEEYSLKDNRINVVTLKKSMGIPWGYNESIARARGEYFARLDGDDFWEPQKLEKQVSILDRKINVGAVATWVNVIDKNGKFLSEEQSNGRLNHFNSKNRSQAEWLSTLFFEKSRLNHPSMLVRADLMEEIGGYNFAYRQLPDYDIWIKIAKKMDIYMIEEPLINYRWDGTNESFFSFEVMNRSHFELFDILTNFFDDIEDNLFVDAFSNAFTSGDYQDRDFLNFQKIMLLYNYKPESEIGKIVGLKKIFQLYNDSEKRESIISKFGLSPYKLSEMASVPLFANFVINDKGESAVDFIKDQKQYTESLVKLNDYYKKVINSYEIEKQEAAVENHKLNSKIESAVNELKEIKNSRWYKLFGKKE